LTVFLCHIKPYYYKPKQTLIKERNTATKERKQRRERTKENRNTERDTKHRTREAKEQRRTKPVTTPYTLIRTRTATTNQERTTATRQ